MCLKFTFLIQTVFNLENITYNPTLISIQNKINLYHISFILTVFSGIAVFFESAGFTSVEKICHHNFKWFNIFFSLKPAKKRRKMNNSRGSIDLTNSRFSRSIKTHQPRFGRSNKMNNLDMLAKSEN